MISSLLMGSSVLYAGEMGVISAAYKTGVFIGLGGSYNSVKLDQYLNPLIGTSNVYNNSGVLQSYGTAAGPANPFHNVTSTFAPEVQAGYFKHFSSHSDALWGIKFQYRYPAVTLTDNDIVAPQFGTLTQVAGGPTDTFTGRALIGSAQATINHELLLIPFIGKSFRKATSYLGVGPAVFGTQTNLDNITGYADYQGTHVDVSGVPTSFSSSKWMWGGAAQIGMAYLFDPTWAVDIYYTYAVTTLNKTNYLASFTSSTSTNVTQGTLYGVASQRPTVQSLAITINKVFSL
jgi:hypothetical protein